MAVTAQSIGRKRNLLHRYKLVMEEFERHYNPDIPITVIYRKHIYPKFGSGINREIQNFCDKHGIKYQTQTYY
jgi:hypothetical protein